MSAPAEDHLRIHRNRQERRPAGDRRRLRAAGDGYYHPADHHCGCGLEGAHLPGRDLRPGARGQPRREISTMPWSWRIDSEYGLTGAVYTNNKAQNRTSPASVLRGQSCISTASARARWWAPIRSAASTCQARIQRQAARTNCCSSCSQSRLPNAFARMESPRCEGDVLVISIGSNPIDATKGDLRVPFSHLCGPSCNASSCNIEKIS